MKMWMKKMDELSYERWQHMFFCKKLNNRNKMEEIYVGLF
jgi:hypothetical protein